MRYKYPFLDVLADLQEAAPEIILVGGWVPTVYFEYLWQGLPSPIRTVDIDLALHANMHLNSPLGEIFNQSCYKEKHLELGKLTPYQIIYGDNIPIDFMADSKDELFIRKKILQKEILLNTKPAYRFLLKDYLKVRCDGIQVNVPQPARYILHKISIYLSESKSRSRDIAMAYYCLTRSPHSDEIYLEIRKLRKESVGKKVIESFTKTTFAKDDLLVVDIESTLRSMGEEENRQEIFRKLKQLTR